MRKFLLIGMLPVLASCASQSDHDWLVARVNNLEKKMDAQYKEQLITTDALAVEDAKQLHTTNYIENELDKIDKRFADLETKLDRLFFEHNRK